MSATRRGPRLRAPQSRRAFVTVAALLAVGLTPGSMSLRAEAPPEDPEPGVADSAAVRVHVDAGNANFMKGWLTADADLFASCFAEDGAMLQPGGRSVIGREAIRARMKDVFQRVRMTEARIETVDLFILGDTAYETGSWWFTYAVGDAPAEADSGRFVEVWKREGNAWRMWRDIGVPR